MTAHHVLVNVLVVEDGEPGHPMDTAVTRVDLGEDGQPAASSMERLAGRIERQIAGRVRRNVAAAAGPSRRAAARAMAMAPR